MTGGSSRNRNPRDPPARRKSSRPFQAAEFQLLAKMFSLARLSVLRHRAEDGLFIFRVAATAADVFLHLRDDFRAGRARIFFQHAGDAHDHARRAIAALKRALRQERLLHRMQLAADSQALDGHDVLLVHVADVCDARGRALAVDEHRAGAALALATAEFCPGQLQILAQHFEQGSAGVGGDGPGFPVHGEVDFGVHKPRVKIVGLAFYNGLPCGRVNKNLAKLLSNLVSLQAELRLMVKSCFTESRFKTRMVKMPSTVPKGMNKHSAPATTRSEERR